MKNKYFKLLHYPLIVIVSMSLSIFLIDGVTLENEWLPTLIIAGSVYCLAVLYTLLFSYPRKK